ncbi:S-layer homology domain-containing protein [Pseudoflavonifractor phocaeensis]|uniref:S-layer homology domain-containing protein n=1 Tax=Pseudoflavonifractor phocaeensis TaxID=1870988 RepID=UPI00195BDE98|nr:S-layer homology domain-containing protein [Pseudoflavonifractor phocaeensis]MBM6925479.1 S-layer homology domain-containing protein [Pseudoflavonifractor phocaeensis]
MKTRTRNLKRLLSLLLCLCLVAGLLPVTVLAAGESAPAEDGFLWLTTDVVADNVEPANGTKLYPGGGTTEGAVYDQGTNTLTLTNFSGSDLNLIARAMGSGFKIVVNGTNTLKCVRVYGGIHGGALTIEGTGTLTINNSADTAYYAGIDLRGEGVETALTIGAEVTLHVTGRSGSGAVSVAPALTDSTPITWGGTLSNGQLAGSPIILSLPAMYMENPYDKYNVYRDGAGKYYGLKMDRGTAPSYDFVYSVYEVTYADGTYTLGADTVPGMVGISEDDKNTWLADKTPVWSDWSNWTISSDATMAGRLDTLSFLPGVSQGPVITVTGSVPAEMKVGDSYNVSLSATGSGTITWSKEGQWPAGIDLRDNEDGTADITGSPTAAGIYTFSVMATDGSGQSATREFTLRVTNEVSQLSWTTAKLAPSTVSLDQVNDYTLTLVPSEALTLPAGTVLSIRAQGVDFTDAAVSDSGFSVSNGGSGAVGIRCDQDATIPAGGVTLTLTEVKNPGGESQIYPTLGALSWDAGGVTYQLPETTMESIRYTGRVLLEGGVCYLVKGNQIYFSVSAYGDGDVTATLHYSTGSDEPKTKAYILERNSVDPTAEGTVNFPADAARLVKTVFSLPGAEPIEWTFDMNRNTATPQMEVTVHAAAGVPLDGACILIQEENNEKTGSMAYDPSSDQPFTMELDKSWIDRAVTVSLAVYQGEYIKLAESGSLTISAAKLNQVTLTVEETGYQSYTLRFQTADGEPVDASGLSGTLEWKGTSLARRESYLFQNTLQAGDLTLKVSNPGEELARDYKMKETYTEGTGLAVDEGTITITLEAWDRSAVITGVVTCGEGDDPEPVAGMRVSAEQTLDGRSFQSVAVSGADGRYTIPNLVPGEEAKITAAAVGYPDYEGTVSGDSLTENGTYNHNITLSGTQGTIFVSLSQLPIPGTAANGSTVQSPTFSVWQPVPVTEGEDDKPAAPDETKTENEAIQVTQVATTGGYYLTLPELPGDNWGEKEVDVTVTAPALAQTGSVVSQGRGGVIRVQLDQRGYGRASFNGLVQMGVVNLGTPTSRDLYYVFVYDSEGALTSVLSPTVSKSIQLPAGEYTAYFLGSLRCTEEVAAAARWSSSWSEIQAAELVAAGAVKQTFTMADGKETVLPDLTVPSDADEALPGSYVRAPHVTPEGEIYEITGVISLPAGARLSTIQCSDLALISAAKVGGKTAALSLGEISPASGSDTGVIPFTIYCRTATNSASAQSEGTVHKVDVTYADANGAEKTVTLGVLSVAYSKLLTLQAPQRVDTAGLTVSGRTEANAVVELYLEQTLLTTVQADGNGRYTATLTLPVNGNRASDHLIMAKLMRYKNTVAYAPVSYVPGEAILTGLLMWVENTVLGDEQEIPMSVNGGSVNLITQGSHDHSFQFTATFENADKLREIGDGAKVLLRVDTDADSRLLVAKDIGNGVFQTDEEVFPSGAMPTQVTPLYASKLPDTAADLTAEEAVLAGVQAAEGQKALEALLDAYDLTPENADRKDLLRAYASMYENVAVAGDPDAADADIILSDTAPTAAGEYEMTFTTQTGMVTDTRAEALVQSLKNDSNYQKSAVNGSLNVGNTTYNSVTNYTRLFFCDKAGQPITDPETIAAGTFAGTVSLTFTVGVSNGGTEVCWTRITTLTPGAKFPSYRDNGTLSGFEPAAATVRNGGIAAILLQSVPLFTGEAQVLADGEGTTTTTTTTETRRLNQEEMQVYFDSGVAGSDISYETYANFVMDAVPLSDDARFMGQTFDYFKNTKALFGEATECEQLGTIADVLEGYRKNLLEIYDTFSGLPTDQCKDLAKLAQMSLDALGDVSEIVDQAQVTHLAVSRITDEMSKVGILVGPLEFTGAGTLYNVSTAFVGLAANATNDQTKAEAQRQFIGFSYLYEQVYNRATAMGYKQGSGGDAGNIEEVTTVTKTVTTNRQRHYTWVENGQLWALVKVIETTTTTTTVELRITYYTGVYRTIPISSDTVETQRYWEEKEVVEPGSDGWSSDTTTEVTENGESVPPSGGSGVEIKHDPSGYVYEAVLSNPVAGATVTLYQNAIEFEPEYAGGDIGNPDYSHVINTDVQATNDRKPYVDYTDAPQINPMTSDQEGHYGWDVPQGLWYVEAEAAGYQPGSSNNDKAAIVAIGNVNWLPVLPPQLDVNIPMVDYSVPTVTKVTPQTDGVYIQFSKYMEEDTLTADSFQLWVDGQTPPFTLEKVDSERAPDNIKYSGTAPSYTSLVRLVPETPLTAGQQVKVAVNVAKNKDLSSYAGTDFPNTYLSDPAPVVQQASVEAPSAANISSGTYYGPQQVTLICNTPGAEIWYTTGSGAFDPDTWTRYTGSIPVSSSVTLSFVAVKDGMLNSAIQTITLQIATPVISGGDTPNPDPGPTPGGGGTVTYGVSVPEGTTGGSVSVSPSRAYKGRTVTITVKPDEGYELDTLTVTDSKGNELELTDKGDGKYTFKMPASKVEIQASFREIVVEPVNPFTDVFESDYYYDAVLWAVENGITKGTNQSGTLFSPDVTLTRAEMVTFLWRAAGCPEPTATEHSFVDVDSEAFYYDAMLWAVENGITNGTGDGTTFSPNVTVTRSQAVTFQWRAAGCPEASGRRFEDVAADAWYTDAVTWAVENGITIGTNQSGTLFSPGMDVSRAQAVTFLWRELA